MLLTNNNFNIRQKVIYIYIYMYLFIYMNFSPSMRSKIRYCVSKSLLQRCVARFLHHQYAYIIAFIALVILR